MNACRAIDAGAGIRSGVGCDMANPARPGPDRNDPASTSSNPVCPDPTVSAPDAAALAGSTSRRVSPGPENPRGRSDEVFQEAFNRVRSRYSDREWQTLSSQQVVEEVYREMRAIDAERQRNPPKDETSATARVA